MNTPVWLPRSDAGSIPARSTASQPTSIRCRCCGSIAVASRGEIPKNAASKSATSSRKPPASVSRSLLPSGLVRVSTSIGQPRSSGNADATSRPSSSSCHRSSGVRTPPGNRHAIDTTATGSSRAASASSSRLRVSRRSAVTHLR